MKPNRLVSTIVRGTVVIAATFTFFFSSARRTTVGAQHARELRELVNTKYRAAGEPELKVRTLQSLVDGIEEERAAVA